MMPPMELKALLEAKRERVKAGDFLQPVVLKRGHVNTENGLLVTADESLKLVQKTEDEQGRKCEEQ